jgi:rare lipoprotein A
MRMRRTIGLSLALLVVAAPAMAKQTQSDPHQSLPSVKSKSAADDAAVGRNHSRRHQASGRLAARSSSRRGEQATQHTAGQLAPPDQYIGPLRVVGAREVGYAAWYGGRHLGRRTATGERLDAVHATAAHRSLPLHSLVLVTNLRNGRSVIATINDRGPVSRNLLIDVSPSCAAELDMMRSGIASVSIEPVAAAPTQLH